jgi:CPA2 family monovalent cation:H+ antiporter-2
VHGLDLIVTLTGGLVAALVGGYITQRLKLSPIVGYILAGLVVGPYTPGFVADRHVAEQLAEVGVILLMFGVGLQLHLEDLLAVKRVAIPGAIFQSLVATATAPAGASAPASSTAWPCRSPAPWSSSACSRTTASCTRRPGTSRSAGWSSRICSRCWCWC